eukprot:TRINITY_DN2064_c0_g4_i1.p1 TRINITY_DN2064_c0_g4~~TRINITY_DN2064_c0_g4_i1.p1  ORF type:complete len:439 (+),score=85.44 TRINITY_DN2064_c0_g4_i1:16-1332(+)
MQEVGIVGLFEEIWDIILKYLRDLKELFLCSKVFEKRLVWFITRYYGVDWKQTGVKISWYNFYPIHLDLNTAVECGFEKYVAEVMVDEDAKEIAKSVSFDIAITRRFFNIVDLITQKGYSFSFGHLREAVSSHDERMFRKFFPHLNRLYTSDFHTLLHHAITVKNKPVFEELYSGPFCPTPNFSGWYKIVENGPTWWQPHQNSLPYTRVVELAIENANVEIFKLFLLKAKNWSWPDKVNLLNPNIQAILQYLDILNHPYNSPEPSSLDLESIKVFLSMKCKNLGKLMKRLFFEDADTRIQFQEILQTVGMETLCKCEKEVNDAVCNGKVRSVISYLDVIPVSKDDLAWLIVITNKEDIADFIINCKGIQLSHSVHSQTILEHLVNRNNFTILHHLLSNNLDILPQLPVPLVDLNFIYYPYLSYFTPLMPENQKDSLRQ